MTLCMLSDIYNLRKRKKNYCELLNNISCSRRRASRPGVLGRNERDARGLFRRYRGNVPGCDLDIGDDEKKQEEAT